MADVRDGEPITLRGLPKNLRAFRHPEGIYLWDGQRHVFARNGSPRDIRHAVIQLRGHAAYIASLGGSTNPPYLSLQRNTQERS